MEKIPFFTPIFYKNRPDTTREWLLEKVDDYFYLGGKKAQAIVLKGIGTDLLNKRTKEVILADQNASMLCTVLKVISYCTLIFPVILLIAKAILRASYDFILKQTHTSTEQNQGLNIQALSNPESPISYDDALKQREETNAMAATKIQTAFRGFIGRIAFKKSEAATKIQAAFRGHRTRVAFKKLEATTKIQTAFREYTARVAFEKLKEENAKKSSPPLGPIPSQANVQTASKPIDTMLVSEFIAWLKEDPDRIATKESSTKLILIVKNAEIEEEELRDLYACFSESLVLQILSFTQTANSFNAVSEKIIEKALILETNFIQAVNKKYPHRNPDLRMKIEQRLLGPSIFRHSMTDQEIMQIGTTFFDNLKKSGQLLTSEQFAVLSKDSYISKSRDLGRILGANYIKKIAEQLGLKHIKTPKKIAVIDKNQNQLQVRVEPAHLALSCQQVTVYAEKITRLTRGTTREEVIEFLKILEATGFGDFMGDNFFLGKNQNGEEGIYFIDTEYTNFRHSPFLEINVGPGITRIVQKKDWAWINQVSEFPSYCSRNQKRINRYFELYNIKEGFLGNLVKTYVPEVERRKKSVEFTYTL